MPEPLYSHTSREYPGFNMNIPDQYRAAQFIHEIDEKYVKTGADLPQFIFIHLPNDHMAEARPEDGYPYEESFVVDNDYALGRILEYLSGTKWWNRDGRLHHRGRSAGRRGPHRRPPHGAALRRPVDRRRITSRTSTPVSRAAEDHLPSAASAAAEPVRRVGRRSERLLRLAAGPGAATNCVDVDRRIFDPDKARQSTNGKPSPKMDDPEGSGTVRLSGTGA